MTSTVRKILEDSAKKIGVLGRGKSFEDGEELDWLNGLRRMLDGWSYEELMIPFRTVETFTLDGNQSYTIGPGGDWNTQRPLSIVDLRIVDSTGLYKEVTEVPLGTLNDRHRPNGSGLPRKYTYEDGAPLAEVRFDKPVSTEYSSIKMWSLKPLLPDLADSSPTPVKSFSITVGEFAPTGTGSIRYGYSDTLDYGSTTDSDVTQFGASNAVASGLKQFSLVTSSGAELEIDWGNLFPTTLTDVVIWIEGFGAVDATFTGAQYENTDQAEDIYNFLRARVGDTLVIQVYAPRDRWRIDGLNNLSGATDLLETFFVERAYENAVIFNLAVVMADDYDLVPSQNVVGLATTYKRNIKRSNLQIKNLKIEPGMTPRRDYYDINDGPG